MFMAAFKRATGLRRRATLHRKAHIILDHEIGIALFDDCEPTCR